MRKSLVVLLAFAMVFTMFNAVVFAADEKTDLERLVDAEVIKGTLSGDTMDDQAFKRQDLAVLISRMHGAEEEAKNHENTHEFADVSDPSYDGYISWAKENGYMQGTSEVNFGYDRTATVQHLLTVLLRAIDIDDWENAVQSALDAGLIGEEVDGDAEAIRGESYAAIAATLDTEVEEGVTLGASLGLKGWVPDLGDMSVKISGANKFEINFGEAVDVDDVGISINKGSITVNQKETTYSDDKTSATVETSTKVTKGDYTVTITGVAADALTFTLTAEDERVTAIEFTSDKAPIDADVKDGGVVSNKGIQAFYKVYNQYGEDVTGSTQITASPGKGEIQGTPNGTVKVQSLSPYVLGEKVHMSLLHNETGTFVSQALEVSPSSSVAEVNIVKLHKPDDKDLTEGVADPSGYHLVVEPVDQYGNPVAAAKVGEQVVTTVTNNSLFDVDRVAGEGNYTQDGNNVILKLAAPPHAAPNDVTKAGTGSIIIISKTTGSRSEIDITVKEAVKVDTINVSAPELAVAGENITIPFTAYDQNGEEITDAGILNGITLKNSSVGTLNFEQDHVKGTANLVLNATGVSTAQTVYFNFVTNSGKSSQLSISLLDVAKPEVITGTKNFTSTLAVDATATLKHDNVVVKDQYGRDYDLNGKSKLGTAADQYKILVSNGNSNVEITGDQTLDGTGKAAVFTAKNKGNLSVTLTLVTGDYVANTSGSVVANSAYTFTASAVSKGDIQSYEVDELGTVYSHASALAGHKKDIKVNGFLSNGTKVAIPVSQYSVVSDVYEVATGKVGGSYNPISGNDDVTKTIVVTINAEGENVVKVLEVVLSPKAPVATTLSLKDSAGDFTKESDGVISVAKANMGGLSDLYNVVGDAVKVVDQYGVEKPVTTYDNTNVFASLSDSQIAGLGQGKSFNVTVVIEGKYITFKVIIK